jgi:drug/metabolite transporter (DMT)-like permease
LQSQSTRSRDGYIYAVASAATAGLLPIFSKLLLVSMKPLAISGVAFLVAGLMFVPFKPKERPTRVSGPWLLLTGLVGAALGPVLYITGVGQTAAVNAALLANAEVFFTAVIAIIVFRERLKRVQLLESIIVIAGIVVVTTGLEFGQFQLAQGLAGNLLILGASLVWAVDNNIMRIVGERFGPRFVAKFRNMIGGGLVLVFLLATSSVVVPLSAIPLLLLYGVDIGIATLTFMASLVRIGTVHTMLVFTTTSVFGSVFAVIFLAETVSLVQVLGGALILFGVVLIERTGRN